MRLMAAVFGFLLTVSPIDAGATQEPARNLKADARREGAQARRELLSRLAPIHRELASGGVSSALLAAMRLGRVVPVSLGVESRRPAVVDRAVPSAIADPVADLISAMDRASLAAGRSIRGDLAMLGRQAAALGAVSAVRSSGSSARPMGTSASSMAHVGRFMRMLDRVVDRPLLYSAALELARSIDRVLPSLRPRGTQGPLPADEDVQCDVAEVGTRLCVGGTGSNTYTTDFDLLIDQGGDDVYLNAAGAADPLVNRTNVAVVIDVAGNDRYEATLPRSDSYLAQGAGRNGGIGILIDAAGDDQHTTTVAEQPPPGSDAFLCAMGCGVTGVGVLADLAGGDSYAVSNSAPSVGGSFSAFGDPWEFERANGLAFGSVGGLGIAADRGGSNDSYLVECHPAPVVVDGVLHGGAALTSGLGYAITGAVAVLTDDGGDDALTSRTINSPEAEVGVGQARGMGVGWTGGSAVAITGDGDTQWRLSAEDVRDAEGIVASDDIGPAVITLANAVVGQGAGTLAGFGALYDSGGDDAFRAAADARIRFAGSSDGTEGAVVKVVAPPTLSFAQGQGNFGNGALVDAGGNDTYTVAGTSHADAVATDLDQTLDGPSATALSGIVQVFGQGGGNGLAANGFLLDGSGNDTYRADGSSRATAVAEPVGDEPAEGIATSETTWNHVQVAQFTPQGGFASLQDLGGADTYWSSASSTAQASPPTKLTEPPVGYLDSWAQAVSRGLGFFLDRDGGSADAFTSIPARNPSLGQRGSGVWGNPTGGTIGINE